MSKLQIVRPVAITLRAHDAQLVVIRDREEQWLKQWTVGNNFYAMVTELGDEGEAITRWVTKHVENAKRHFSYLVPEQYREAYNFAADFYLEYSVAEFELYKPFYLEGEKCKIAMIDHCAK